MKPEDISLVTGVAHDDNVVVGYDEKNTLLAAPLILVSLDSLS